MPCWPCGLANGGLPPGSCVNLTASACACPASACVAPVVSTVEAGSVPAFSPADEFGGATVQPCGASPGTVPAALVESVLGWSNVVCAGGATGGAIVMG